MSISGIDEVVNIFYVYVYAVCVFVIITGAVIWGRDGRLSAPFWGVFFSYLEAPGRLGAGIPLHLSPVTCLLTVLV